MNQNETIKRAALHTLGCRLNFAETGSLANGFAERGYEIVSFGEPADVTFINTCTVTDKADSTCRNLIRKAHKANPEGKIVVAGCYAQMEPEAIAEMQGVDLVLGNNENYKVFDYLGEDSDTKINIDKSWEFYGAATSPSDSHTRAFLKIQDGCNYICSFCIIPFARGRSRAISIADAKTEATKIVESGFQEIVLTGVNIGEYENSSGEKLVDLVRAMVEIEGLERLRLSSVEPNTITDELLTVLKESGKYQDHFHIPLQSADDGILRGMKRKYTISEYEAVIEKCLEYFPNAGIGADLIVGFPGETDEQFQNTLDFAKRSALTHFHVFPYSKRKNTVASKLDTHIPHHVKKERVKALIALGEAKLRMFTEDNIGKRHKVLFERQNKEGLWEGYTSNFVRVYQKSEEDLKNQIRSVELMDFMKEGALGEFIH